MNDKYWESRIDEILYGEHEQPYSKGDSLLMLMYEFYRSKSEKIEEDS